MGRNKLRFDKQVTASDLSVGDRVLVRNVRLRGKHKLANRWEPDVYIVQKKAGTLPVYTVKPETKDRPIRTLHCDLLLPCGYLSPASNSDKTKQTSVTSSTPVTPESTDLPDPEDPDLQEFFLPDNSGSSPTRFTTVIDLSVPAPAVVPVPVIPPGQRPQGFTEEEPVGVDREMESGPEPTVDLEPELESIELDEDAEPLVETDSDAAIDSDPPEENASSQPEPVLSSLESEPPVRRPNRIRRPPTRLQYSKPGHPFLHSIQSLFQGLSTMFTSALQLEETPLATAPSPCEHPVRCQPPACTRPYMSLGGEPVTCI